MPVEPSYPPYRAPTPPLPTFDNAPFYIPTPAGLGDQGGQMSNFQLPKLPPTPLQAAFNAALYPGQVAPTAATAFGSQGQGQMSVPSLPPIPAQPDQEFAMGPGSRAPTAAALQNQPAQNTDAMGNLVPSNIKGDASAGTGTMQNYVPPSQNVPGDSGPIDAFTSAPAIPYPWVGQPALGGQQGGYPQDPGLNLSPFPGQPNPDGNDTALPDNPRPTPAPPVGAQDPNLSPQNPFERDRQRFVNDPDGYLNSQPYNPPDANAGPSRPKPKPMTPRRGAQDPPTWYVPSPPPPGSRTVVGYGPPIFPGGDALPSVPGQPIGGGTGSTGPGPAPVFGGGSGSTTGGGGNVSIPNPNQPQPDQRTPRGDPTFGDTTRQIDTIDPGNWSIGPDGRPVGPDGQPLTVPSGGQSQTGQTGTTADGRPTFQAPTYTPPSFPDFLFSGGQSSTGGQTGSGGTGSTGGYSGGSSPIRNDGGGMSGSKTPGLGDWLDLEDRLNDRDTLERMPTVDDGQSAYDRLSPEQKAYYDQNSRQSGGGSAPSGGSLTDSVNNAARISAESAYYANGGAPGTFDPNAPENRAAIQSFAQNQFGGQMTAEDFMANSQAAYERQMAAAAAGPHGQAAAAQQAAQAAQPGWMPTAPAIPGTTAPTGTAGTLPQIPPAASPGGTSGPDPTVMQLSQQYQDMTNAANAANEARYQEIRGGYAQRESDTASAFAQQTDQDKQDIDRSYDRERSRANQDMVNRGLGNTTVRESTLRGLTEDQNAAHRRLSDAKLLQRLGLSNQLSGDRLSFMERRTDLPPDIAQLLAIAQQIGAGGGTQLPFPQIPGSYIAQ